MINKQACLLIIEKSNYFKMAADIPYNLIIQLGPLLLTGFDFNPIMYK